MTILRTLQTLATGKYLTTRRCKGCGRRLFDGFMVGEILCRCGVMNVFALDNQKEKDYIVKST